MCVFVCVVYCTSLESPVCIRLSDYASLVSLYVSLISSHSYDEYAQEEQSSSSSTSSGHVDLSSYSGKYPPEKAARLVQNAYRRWKTLATTKRLAKRAWTLRRFLNSEKVRALFVCVCSVCTCVASCFCGIQFL